MKDGILLIDKPSGMTSRDVVNKIGKSLGTRKVGHTGTLDPLATGLMVVCVNKATKLVELLTNHDKSYLVKVKLGLKTDTYDITGKVLEENYNYSFDIEKLKNVLESFIGKYEQEVPIYSAIKVNGRKLYEYARNNEKITLPIHLVEIKEIKLLDYDKESFSFRVLVSKGTYIRSLVNDISNKLGILMTMQELRRITVDKFNIENAINLENVSYNNLIDIKKVLDIPIITVSGILEKHISNGMKIDNTYNEKMVLFVNSNQENIAIYQENDDGYLVCYKMF